jgi:orotate phosphoribosyltransferase
MYYNYPTSFFNSDLKKWGELYTKALPEDVTCILTTGGSGCSIGSAIMMLTTNPDLKHAHLKKNVDVAHSRISFYPTQYDTVAIVDDFIATGVTVDTLVKFAQDHNFEIKYCLVTFSGLNVELNWKFKTIEVIPN